MHLPDVASAALTNIESVTVTVGAGCDIYTAARAAFAAGELLRCGQDGATLKFNDRLYRVILWYDEIDPKTGRIVLPTGAQDG